MQMNTGPLGVVIGVATDMKGVLILFESPVNWIVITPNQARMMAAALLGKAAEADDVQITKN